MTTNKKPVTKYIPFTTLILSYTYLDSVPIIETHHSTGSM